MSLNKIGDIFVYCISGYDLTKQLLYSFKGAIIRIVFTMPKREV